MVSAGFVLLLLPAPATPGHELRRPLDDQNHYKHRTHAPHDEENPRLSGKLPQLLSCCRLKLLACRGTCQWLYFRSTGECFHELSEQPSPCTDEFCG